MISGRTLARSPVRLESADPTPAAGLAAEGKQHQTRPGHGADSGLGEKKGVDEKSPSARLHLPATRSRRPCDA